MPKNFFVQSSEWLMVSFAILILFILFLPIPALFLDLLLILNFSWALSLLLMTFYTDKPLSFSTFPALLLISTLFRLALNISATRLILNDAHAGKVIDAMGSFVIQGNYVMGLVVFLILIIVQFIVVTNGAQRVAEVAARFTLDSMPGKQMSIDADLNMGSISLDDAKQRRSQIEKEANFYGAMDGASKFVKGDAIAGILIILVDIAGGLAIGLLQKGFTINEAIQRYTLLTVGDGLVTQIPALIISIATGIIVTRAATDTQLGAEVARQITAYPATLIFVCISLITLLFLKGIPVLPVLIIFMLYFGLTVWTIYHKKSKPIINLATATSLYEQIRIHPIELLMNPELYKLMEVNIDISTMINKIREQIAFDLGLVIPEVCVKPERKLIYPYYQINIQGTLSPATALYLDKVLAIESAKHPDLSVSSFSTDLPVREPSYALTGYWIAVHEQSAALEAGYRIHEPLRVLTTHLNEMFYAHLTQLLTREETEKLLSQPGIKVLGTELIPHHLSLGQVQRILQNLLQEKVSIRPLALILELLLEHSKQQPELLKLTEVIRQGLGSSICQKLITPENLLSVLLLETQIEQKMLQAITNQEHLNIEPDFTERFITALAQEIERMVGDRKRPILLCASLLRKPIRHLTQRILPGLTILGMNEIPIHIQVESWGVVKMR